MLKVEKRRFGPGITGESTLGRLVLVDFSREIRGVASSSTNVDETSVLARRSSEIIGANVRQCQRRLKAEGHNHGDVRAVDDDFTSG